MQNTKVIPLVEPLFPHSCSDEVKEQIQSGFVGVGHRTNEFSEAIASFVGAPNCLLTISGTIALSVAAIGLGLKAGDEILVPSYGVISTINAFASIGLKPRLVDIDRLTGCMSPNCLMNAISEKTRAVCFVDFTGYVGPNLIKIKEICEQKGIPLIEDAACALGNRYENTYSGLFGTVGIYSFSVPKILTTGQGGAIVTKDKTIYEKAAAYIDQGDLEWHKTNLNRGIGSNLRFNDILSTLGLAQLRNIDLSINRKRIVFKTLQHCLGEKIFSVPAENAPLHNIVFPKDPEIFMEKLKEAGIVAARGYRTISTHPAYQYLAKEEFPQSDFWANHAVFLPFGLALSKDDGEYIAQVVKKFENELLEIRS